MRVSVIVPDRVIVLDGEPLVCELPASAGKHALQWNGTVGHIEHDDGQNEILRDASAVQPYIRAWETERDRRAAAVVAERAIYRASPQFEVDLLARIDVEAEQVRARYITPGAGQAMVYQAKQAEARRYRDAGYPADLAGYALLDAEVG
ncbi:MAG TPA: hypothetical protein VK943_14240, partial [Arenibaculum sp.]|nr:hypothetical protein [Arenibaculum sp.]